MERITRQQYLKLLKKTPKYHNTKTEYQKILYDSKKEAEMAKILNFRVYAKEIGYYTRQERIPLEINEHHICDYLADFALYNTHGDFVEVIEVKGYRTAVWKLKEKLFRVLYPSIILTVV